MTGPETLDLARESIFVLLQMSGPIMLVALSVGLTIALFQALTQIQEMTLVFVPKILSIFLSLMVALPFMGQVMSAYMERIFMRIAAG